MSDREIDLSKKPDMILIGKENVVQTLWRNDTDDILDFKIPVKHGDGKKTPNGSFVGTPASSYAIRLEPGDEVSLDPQYDDAIRKVRGGRVVAGIAPQLTKVDHPNYSLHPNIDPKIATKQAEAVEAEKYLMAHKAATDSLNIAVANKLKREEKVKNKKKEIE